MTLPILARRDVLALGLGAGASLALPRAARAALGGNVLVLIELNGGNDGLNTVVPHADRAYRRARPKLALGRDDVLPLDERRGLNKALAPLMPLWSGGELALVEGVGYAPPNRSHFRSIEIVETADADTFGDRGWIAGALAETGAGGLDADGVVLGGPPGPLAGPRARTIVMHDPDRFLRVAERLSDGAHASGPAALRHVLAVRQQIHDAAGAIGARLAATPAPAVDFPPGAIGRQLAVAARLIAAGLPVAALKLRQSCYDTHARQRGTHDRLLGQLAQGLAAFRAALTASGDWRRTLVMTYAEFGRRVAENGSGGTDHGTAAPHFVLGGRVRGGLYGAPPSLDDLDGGDLRHTTDVRRMYATAVEGWWELPAAPATLGNSRPLDLLRV